MKKKPQEDPRYDTNVVFYLQILYLRRRPCEKGEGLLSWCKRWTSTIGDNDVQHSLSITLI